VLPGALPARFPFPPAVTRGVGIALAKLAFSSTSFVVIDATTVWHLKRVWFGASRPAGRITAQRSENGPQAEVVPRARTPNSSKCRRCPFKAAGWGLSDAAAVLGASNIIRLLERRELEGRAQGR
jgi:hypothetical protein